MRAPTGSQWRSRRGESHDNLNLPRHAASPFPLLAVRGLDHRHLGVESGHDHRLHQLLVFYQTHRQTQKSKVKQPRNKTCRQLGGGTNCQGNPSTAVSGSTTDAIKTCLDSSFPSNYVSISSSKRKNATKLPTAKLVPQHDITGYCAFLTNGHSKAFMYNIDVHPFIHTFTPRRRCQPRKATTSPSGAVRVRCLAQGHLDTREEEPEIEPGTFQLPANPLYLLSPMPPRISRCLPTGRPASTHQS